MRFRVPFVGVGLICLLGAVLSFWRAHGGTPADADPSLAAQWRFEEKTGSEFNDSAHHCSPGKLHGAEWTSGKSGGGLQFDGKQSFAEIPHCSHLDLTKSLTLEAWVNLTRFPQQPPGWGAVLSKGEYDESYCLMIRSTGELLVYLKGLEGGVKSEYNVTTFGVVPGIWYHLVVTYDGDSLTVYANGEMVDSRPRKGSVATTTSPLTLGATKGLNGPNYFLLGMVDEVSLYTRALSAAEVKQQFLEVQKQSERTESNAVYVMATDHFSPPSAISDQSELPVYGKWQLRRVPWAARGSAVLYLNEGAYAPDLSASPQLTGYYDVYVGIRQVDRKNGFQLRLGDDDLYYTVDPGVASPDYHPNMEILVAHSLRLDNLNILLHPYGPTVYFNYLKFMPATKGQTAPVPLPYIRRQARIDYATYERKIALSGERQKRFRKVAYVDNAVFPTLSPKDREQGYVLFARHYLDLVFPNSIPRQAELGEPLEVKATPGEYEPTTFALRTLQPLSKVRVSVSPLRSLDGHHQLPASAIQIFQVRCMPKRCEDSYRVPSDFMVTPVWLDARLPTEIPADTNVQFWLTLKAPLDSAPGNYRGTVSVSAMGKEPSQLLLEVTIYPFRLQEPPGFTWAMIDDFVVPSDTIESTVQRYTDMRQHGMTSVAWMGNAGLKLSLKGDKVRVEFRGSDLERVLEAYKQVRFPQPIVWLMGWDIKQWCQEQAPPHSEKFARVYKEVITAIQTESQKRDWPPIIYQPEDECASNPGRFESAIRQLQLLKEVGARTEMDHQVFEYKNETLQGYSQRALPFTDICTFRYSNNPIWYDHPWNEIIRRGAALGKTMWTYNINDGLAFPELASVRFANGFFNLTLGKALSGMFWWVYQDVSGSAYDDLDGSSTDWLWAYPPDPQRNEVGGPGLIWEAAREGVDDYKYVYTLRHTIARARRSTKVTAIKAADHAEHILGEILNSFDLERMKKADRFVECKWEETLTLPSGEKAMKGKFNVPNGWDLVGYDRARARIAAEIVRLQQALETGGT